MQNHNANMGKGDGFVVDGWLPWGYGHEQMATITADDEMKKGKLSIGPFTDAQHPFDGYDDRSANNNNNNWNEGGKVRTE